MTIRRSSGVVLLISEKPQARIYPPFLQIPIKEYDYTTAFSLRKHQRTARPVEEGRFKRDHPLEVTLPDGQAINIFLKEGLADLVENGNPNLSGGNRNL